jgi:hypothetical protein
MVHPAITVEQQRLMLLVDDVGDMAVRVLANGPELRYAAEKLGFALERLAAALVLVGWTPEAVAEKAGEAARGEASLAPGDRGEQP